MIITRREWEFLAVGKNGIPEDQVSKLRSLAERSAKRLKLPSTAVLTREFNGFRAGQVVGILAIPGLTVEILPKIGGNDDVLRKALVRMIAVAQDFRITEGELTSLHTQKHDLLELLIELFARRLLVAVRCGLPRRYITNEDDIHTLRGKLDITRQFTSLAVRPNRLACRFDELSANTSLNRVLKAAVLQLTKLTQSTNNYRLLVELTARFEFVGRSQNPLLEAVSLDRTNTAFHDLYNLACLFLKRDWQSTTRGETAKVFSLLFPMNELFEKFIGQTLKKVVFRNDKVELQHSKHYALTDAEGQIFALQPDAFLKTRYFRIILDTKWKHLKDERKLGVSSSDVYQLLAYAQAYNATRLVILYPFEEKVGLKEGVVRTWKVAGSDCLLDIATIDVSRPEKVNEILRDIIYYTHPVSKTNTAAA